ncbi:PadR family transcriptional regulator [Shewanella sp. GXUN23E]|uniref:PadR family transcriptional regulator n=1 Tax=Shewanella sp. GXUN23E TaxID=3422498 RepID=UPI003D7E9A2C
MVDELASNSQTEKWDVQLRKGTLELVVLGALWGGEKYGLELLRLLHRYPTMQITEGTLYPLLDRLKRDKLISARWHQEGESRPRKYFLLTELGEQKLLELQAKWRQSVEDISALLSQGKADSQKTNGASDD